MYDLTIIPGQHENLTHSKDEYGEYGSVFASDEDRGIPPPLNFNPNPALEQTANPSSNSTSRVTHRVKPKPKEPATFILQAESNATRGFR